MVFAKTVNLLLSELQQAVNTVSCIEFVISNPSIVAPNTHASVIDWSQTIKSERFHPIFSSSLISAWAVFEAGIEELIAALVHTSRDAGGIAILKLKPGRFDINKWPWTHEARLAISRGLHNKAMKLPHIEDERYNIAARYAAVFSFFDIQLPLSKELSALLDEVSTVRNVLVHRFGVISKVDAEKIQGLRTHENTLLRIDSSRLAHYSFAMETFIQLIAQGISRSKYEAEFAKNHIQK